MWQSEKHTFLPNFTLFNNAGVRSCDFSTAEQALSGVFWLSLHRNWVYCTNEETLDRNLWLPDECGGQ